MPSLPQGKPPDRKKIELVTMTRPTANAQTVS
jgi:hypothetical protein